MLEYYTVERKQHISAVNQSLSLSSYDFFLSPKVSNKKNSDHGRVHWGRRMAFLYTSSTGWTRQSIPWDDRMTTNISKVETRRRRRKKPQIIENIIPWLFFPSRKPHSKTDSKKRYKNLYRFLFCYAQYHLWPFTTVLLPLSLPHWNRHKSQRGAKEEQPLYSRLYFSHDWSEKREKKVCCSNPQCVHTDIYVLYIYFRCTTAAATDKRRRKKGRHSIAQLLSDSNRRNRNPTDRPNPRWKRRKKKAGEKMMMMAISR